MRAAWLPWLCWIATAPAAVYKYVDAGGIVSYTDDKTLAAPYGGQELEYLDPDPDKVKLRYSPNGNLYIINELYGPVTVTLLFSTHDGLSLSRPLDEPLVIPERSEQFVATLHYQGNAPLQIRHQFVMGAPSRQTDGQLRVPFRGRFRVSQGFEGRFSHHLPGNRYALDVPMPEGTPVLAAQDGVVVDLRMGFRGSSLDPAARARTNYIRLLHADGSMTVYAHLRTDSARVAAGQPVRAGEMIAESGNTGYSTAPHLHFALQRNDGQRLVSIPFRLNCREPQQGDWLSDQ